MPVRINKYISESGYCSRREADKYIEQGSVTIDEKKAEVGSQVSPGQVVKVFGETISNNIKSVIIAYNKPVGVVSTTDLDERNNIIDAIGYPERIFPIGRLDKDSQGLILLTNEGNIVNKILRANNNHDKEYVVMVNKAINAEFIQRMQGGIPILGVVTRKCEVTQQGPKSFTIVLRQGLNRQIRRMCEYLGYTVTKLQRTRIMHIHLGNLKAGQYRSLTPAEMGTLYKKIETSTGTGVDKPKPKQTSKQKPARGGEGSVRRNEAATIQEKRSGEKKMAGKVRAKSATNGRTAPTGSSTKTKPSGKTDSFKPRGKGQRRSGSSKR